MPRLMTCVVAGWLLLSSGCASEPAHHDHDHDHDHPEGEAAPAPAPAGSVRADWEAARAEAKKGHGKLHEEFDRAKTRHDSWAKAEKDAALLAEHQQVVDGYKPLFDRDHDALAGYKKLEPRIAAGEDEAALRAELKRLADVRAGVVRDAAALRERHEALATKLGS